MTAQLHESIVVRREALGSDEPYELVESNAEFVDALRGDYVRDDEQFPDALRSYAVDAYLGQVLNGGFSQFVYNTGWASETKRLVNEGLRAMGAERHIEFFGKAATRVDELGDAGLRRFLTSPYFGKNEDRDLLDTGFDGFLVLEKEEGLAELNSTWLAHHAALEAVDSEGWAAAIERVAALVPDREARVAEALASEPRYMKLIRLLCEDAGHELSHVTAGNPNYVYERPWFFIFKRSVRVFSWSFITDQGHHRMLEIDGKALMVRGTAGDPIAILDAPGEL